MIEITLHPNVYSTGPSKGLIQLLERAWLREQTPGDGTLYLISGFANCNGGVRFFPVLREHVESGGKIVAVFAGSNSSKLTSREVVRELRDCGADVYIVNRKRILHAKAYGSTCAAVDMAIITSGNFTGPGMS